MQTHTVSEVPKNDIALPLQPHKDTFCFDIGQKVDTPRIGGTPDDMICWSRLHLLRSDQLLQENKESDVSESN